MAPRFTPPGFAPREYPDVPRTLDAVFAAYEAQKQQGLQNRLRATELATQGVNPEVLDMRDPALQDIYARARQLRGLELAGQGIEPTAAGVEPPTHPDQLAHYNTAVQELIESKRRSTAAAQGKTEAEAIKAQADAAKAIGAAADYYSPEQAAYYIGGDEAAQKAAVGKLELLYPEGRVPKDFVHGAASSAARGLTLGEKHDQYLQRQLTALGEALDPSKQRAGAFGISKQVFDRAERLQSLASAFRDSNLDSRQIEELAIGLNAMLSGSSVGAQSQVAALVPRSVVGDVTKLKEWLTNEPRGTNQQAFVQRMLGSIEREKATASDQIKRTQMQRVTRFAKLEKLAPDDFFNILQSAGVEPDEYKAWKAGGFQAKSAVRTPEQLGYKTADEVKAAVQAGALPRAQGVAILQRQFGYK